MFDFTERRIGDRKTTNMKEYTAFPRFSIFDHRSLVSFITHIYVSISLLFVTLASRHPRLWHPCWTNDQRPLFFESISQKIKDRWFYQLCACCPCISQIVIDPLKYSMSFFDLSLQMGSISQTRPTKSC